MKPSDSITPVSYRHRLLTGAARAASHHPWWVIAIGLFSAFAGGMYGVQTIQLISDQDELLSEDLLYHRRYRDFIRKYGDLEFIYIVIEGGTERQKIEFAGRVAEKLDRLQEHFTQYYYRFDTTWGRKYALFFMDTKDLRELVDGLLDSRRKLEQLAATPTLNSALQDLRDAISDVSNRLTNPIPSESPNHQVTGSEPPSQLAKAFNTDDLNELVQAIEGKGDAPFQALDRLVKGLSEADQHPYEYFWSERRNFLFMLVMPRKDFTDLAVIAEPLSLLRDAVDSTEADVPGVTAGLTGRPVLQADEMQTTNQDMKRAGIISFVGVLVIFMVFFQELWRPLLAGLALLVAVGWTYGFTAITLGRLNLLSAVFVIILVGLGIDFGIHIVHRYQEELRKFHFPGLATERTLSAIGSGLISGACTTAAPFLLAMITQFRGLAELGWVAGSGILFCLLAMTLLLLAFLNAYDGGRRGERRIHEPFHLAGLRHGARHPKTILVLLIAGTVTVFPKAEHVRFDDNLLELQAEGLESIEYERKLLKESGNSTWFCAFLCPTLDATWALHQKLKESELVGEVESLATILPDDLAMKSQLIQRLKEGLAPMPVEEPAFQPDIQIVHQTADGIEALLERVSRGGDLRDWERVPTLGLLARLRDTLRGDRLEERLTAAHESLFVKPRHAFRLLHQLSHSGPLGVDSLPESLRQMFVGRDGSYLVRAYPQFDVWQEHNMVEFVQAMRLLDDTVVGTPIQVYESSQLMRRSFLFAGGYAFVAVVLLVYWDFLSWRLMSLALLPLILGIYWMLGLMGIFDLHLNLANFFAVPILLGIGVDNAIHFLHRYQETTDIDTSIHTTGTTLTLTSITTAIGFGSLLLAHHRGLQSLGGLMVLGTFSCWMASVIFLPNLLKVVPGRWLKINNTNDVNSVK